MGAHAARAARLIAAVAVALATLAVPAAQASTTSTTCDPATAYEACGGVVSDGTAYDTVVAIPGLRGSGGNGSGNGGSSGCVNCEWRVVPACLPNGPQPGQDAMCASASMACGAVGDEGILMRVYVSENGGPWHMRGTYCTGGDGGIVTIADITGQAADAYLDRMRPRAAMIGTQPAGRQVVNIPTYFRATGVDRMTGTFGPPAVRIAITATPTYVWDFGDGATLETQSRGGPYPTGDVRHTYTAAATRMVRLTTRWHAEFTVTSALGTFGPFVVGGPPVAPSVSRAVEVREARAVLVAD